MRLSDLLSHARQVITPHSETPNLDAQLLMMKSVGMPRSWILAHPEAELDPSQVEQFQWGLSRYLDGEALPYILGWWDFYGRRFHITDQVLIPRPETEHLVEVSLSRLAARPAARRIADIGTGSGCVVVSLAAEFGDRSYLATDISLPALKLAKRNIHHYGLERCVALVQADWLRCVQAPFDLVVANLPYLRTDAMAGLAVAGREPKRALDGGEDGLDPLRELAPILKRTLAPAGELILELDPEQMEAAEAIVSEQFAPVDFQRFMDLAGRERVLHVLRVGG